MSYFKTQWIVLKPIFGYHFLSKSEKACFSVFPNNLVACCDPCNKHKGSKIPNSRNKQLVHPYFEDFSNVQWLKCKVRRTSPVSFEFFVHRAEELSEVDFERLKNQFVELKLNDLFISNAGRFYATLKPRLERRFHTEGWQTNVKNSPKTLPTY
jgi:hypothetical protein